MIMDNISLGTLASWFSDCKVENKAKLGSIHTQGKINPTSKQISSLKIWNPWSSENSVDASESEMNRSVGFTDSQINLQCLPSECNKKMSETSSIQTDRLYRPFQVGGTSSDFTNNWNCQGRYINYVGPKNSFVLPSISSTVDADIASKNCARKLFGDQIYGPRMQNNFKLINSEVPKVFEIGDGSSTSSVKNMKTLTGNWQTGYMFVEPKVEARDNLSHKAAVKVQPSNSCNQHEFNYEECQEDKHFERLVLNQIEKFPSCDCNVPRPFDEALDGPFYTHLGVSGSVQGIRDMINKRLNTKDDELRLEKVIYTGKEGKSREGCPIAKWIIRRSSLKEKVLVLVRKIRYHYCRNSVVIIGICLWEGLPEDHATELYDYLRITLPKYGEATERRCATNDKRTCACQGWNETSGGASFSFGCSWSMYYNGCKFARSISPKKFHLKNNSEEELILEHHLQTLATVIAPIYKMVAPTSFKNQTMFESVASDCRLGYKEGRPWSGVTAVVDFCTHSHKDFNNMNNGCTTVLTLTKHRGLEKPEDEQLHVLPLCVLDTTDEFESKGGMMNKKQSGALECLTSFPALVRMRSTPFVCKRKQRQVKAITKKSKGNAKKYKKSTNSSKKDCDKPKTAAIVKKELVQVGSSNSGNLYLSSGIETPTILPGFSQFVSSLSNFGKVQDMSNQNYSQIPTTLTNFEGCSYELYPEIKGFASDNNSSYGYLANNHGCGADNSSEGATSGMSRKSYNTFHSLLDPREQALKFNFIGLPEQSSYLSNQRCAQPFPLFSDSPCMSIPQQANIAPHSKFLGFYPNSDNHNEGPSFPLKCNLPSQLVRGDENSNPQADRKFEMFTDNCEAFKDENVGGVAIALTHGSLLFEVAKRELHATTALKTPDRSKPTRMSLVFYQHKSLNKTHHGRVEYEKKIKERSEKKVEETTHKCLTESELLFPCESKVESLTQHIFDSQNWENSSLSLPLNLTKKSTKQDCFNKMSVPGTPHVPLLYLNQDLQNPSGNDHEKAKHGSTNYFCGVGGEDANLYLPSFVTGRKF